MHICRRDRPHFASGDRMRGIAEEYLAACQGVITSYGHYGPRQSSEAASSWSFPFGFVDGFVEAKDGPPALPLAIQDPGIAKKEVAAYPGPHEEGCVFGG